MDRSTEIIIYDVEDLPFGTKVKVDGKCSVKTTNDIECEDGTKYKNFQKVTLGWG